MFAGTVVEGIPVMGPGRTDPGCAKSVLLEMIPITIHLLRFMLLASMDGSIGSGAARAVESL
jgi:hypothetical protein